MSITVMRKRHGTLFYGYAHKRTLSMDHVRERRLKLSVGHYDPTTIGVITQYP